MLSFIELSSRIRAARKSYDPKCYELAEHFLPNGTDDQKDALAQEIQRAVEDHLWEPEQ